MVKSYSTGHYARLQDLTGKRFSRWTVLSRGPDGKRGIPTWLCRCQCGIERFINGYNLTAGISQSCGCGRCSMGGYSRTKEYQAWKAMLRRCFNSKDAAYPNYGQRGITVCSAWLSFRTFLEDVGASPSTSHSIDRIDNDGHYSCGKCDQCREHQWKANCRWTTTKEQSRNRRSNRAITHNGATRTIAEWAEVLGIRPDTLHWRLARWPLSRALS